MTKINRTTLACEALDRRDVPASMSFTYSDATYGSGVGFASFSKPAGVDASQSSQTLTITDLNFKMTNPITGLENYTPTGTPTAEYSYGELVGISVVVDSSTTPAFEEVQISNWIGNITNSGVSFSAIAYDSLDSALIFSLPDGTYGSLSYGDNISVDDTLASQSIYLTDFYLNAAGHVLQPWINVYTIAPSLQFSYGQLVGVTFSVPTIGLSDFPYDSLSMSGGMNISATPTGGAPIAGVAVANPTTKFTNGPNAVPNVGGAVNMSLRWDNCNGAKTVEIEVKNKATGAVVGSESRNVNAASGSLNNITINSSAAPNTKVTVTIYIKNLAGVVIAERTEEVTVN